MRRVAKSQISSLQQYPEQPRRLDMPEKEEREAVAEVTEEVKS